MNEPGRFRIVIVGGGLTAAMTASALVAKLDRRAFDIVVVDTGGDEEALVATAATPALRRFLTTVGLEEVDLLRWAGAGFRLGANFVDWGFDGSDYVHAFAPVGYAMHGVSFHHYWVRYRAAGGTLPFDAFSKPAAAARSRRLPARFDQGAWVPDKCDYGYHLDLERFRELLRRHVDHELVVHRGHVGTIDCARETGHVHSVTLTSGTPVLGDLFIDCTGQAGELMCRVDGGSFEDWSALLPCDRFITGDVNEDCSGAPLSTIQAQPGGWSWRMPTQAKTNVGVAFSSQLVGEPEAERRFAALGAGRAAENQRSTSIRPGMRRDQWVGNCVALGEAACVVDPVESCGLLVAQKGIEKLLVLLHSSEDIKTRSADFNAEMAGMYEDVRDLSVLHYLAGDGAGAAGALRDVCRTASPRVQERIDRFRGQGELRRRGSMFDLSSWITILIGQGILPDRVTRDIAEFGDGEINHQLDLILRKIGDATSTMPLLEDAIAWSLSWSGNP